MQQPIRKLTLANISKIQSEFDSSLAMLGESVKGKTGFPLLESLKREKVKTGPYPNVTLFEAANRIMSDLVILHGVAGLLQEKIFPFSEYIVEFGNEDKNGFDIRASSPSATLVGEAFNVAPSFFQGKKRTALKKLREKASQETYRIIMFNSDAPPANYMAKHEPNIFHVSVQIPSGIIVVEPNNALKSLTSFAGTGEAGPLA
jgi:hypothetical protein